VGSIGRGLLILLGVGRDDDEATAEGFARRLAELRIFADVDGRTNDSVADVGGAVLVVSQFTLYADISRGRRPGFTDAAPPERAAELYETVCRSLANRGIPVERGIFGASMDVELVNEGPFTLVIAEPAGRQEPAGT
jgi:D-tyrosyl-tRNA(Tyr) deacylase